MKLYHGSKSKIDGVIKPCSRPECDFGQGFYMGDNKHICEAWVSDDMFEMPHIYELEVDIDNINVYSFDNNRDWYLYIAKNRIYDKISKYPGLLKYLQKFDDYDLLIGTIADDRLIYSMNEFFNGNINEKALIACLDVFNYGLQYVAKNKKACEKIKILSSIELDKQLRENNNKEVAHRLESIKDVVNQVKVRYRNADSKYFDQILEEFI